MASTEDRAKVREHLNEANGSTIHLIDGYLVTYEKAGTPRRSALDNMDITALLGAGWKTWKGWGFFIFHKTEKVINPYVCLILFESWSAQVHRP
ncbi:hypothetical protein ACCS93_39260 [Rhizobium ruizarguesonis]